MRKLIVLALFIVFSCAEKNSGKKISEADFGDKWPLTVTEGYVDCINQAVVFTANNKTYAVNGFAKSQKQYADLEEIWKHDASLGGEFRMDIGPVLDSGLKLCK